MTRGPDFCSSGPRLFEGSEGFSDKSFSGQPCIGVYPRSDSEDPLPRRFGPLPEVRARRAFLACGSYSSTSERTRSPTRPPPIHSGSQDPVQQATPSPDIRTPSAHPLHTLCTTSAHPPWPLSAFPANHSPIRFRSACSAYIHGSRATAPHIRSDRSATPD